MTLALLVIALAVTTGFIVLAQRGRGKRNWKFQKYIRGNVDNDFALGTLAASTGVVSANVDAVTERTWVSSLHATWTMSGFTVGDNIGPIEVGVAHGDYSLAEIEAWIEQNTGWAETDLVSREVANRKIRRVGVFEAPEGGGLGASVLFDRVITTKLGWILTQGQTIQYWAYNMGTGAVATTDPNVHVRGHANLWPR